MIKVNIGCGFGWMENGWIGIDYDGTASSWKNNRKKLQYINCNILDGLPFEDNSVDVIYMSHVLEHFTFQEAHLVLGELNRCLTYNGVLAIIVPDLDFYIEQFCQRNESTLCESSIVGGRLQNTLTDNFLMNFYSDPDFNNTCHKYAYNFENLFTFLADMSFYQIRKAQYRNFEYVPDINGDNFKSFSLYAEKFSLCVECKKERDFIPEHNDNYQRTKSHVVKVKKEAELLQIIHTLKIETQNMENMRKLQLEYIEKLEQENVLLLKTSQVSGAEISSIYLQIYLGMLCRHSKVIVFGAGKAGRLICDKLLKYEKNVDIILCDNDVSKQGTSYQKIQIISPSVAFDIRTAGDFICAIGFIDNPPEKIYSVLTELKRCGVPEAKTVVLDMNVFAKE
jgi:predicted SAM-dependent methyltransferase